MSELTVVGQGGLGVDLGNRLFKLSPSTISINQPNTQIEGALRGKLRISDTGQQFDEMIVTLLKMPHEQRAYYAGKAEQLNRTAENLLCFSKDLIRPSEAAKDVQSPLCATCPQGDSAWARWRETKDKKDIPQCDKYIYALFIDTVLKMPLQMYIRSKNKAPFEAGMSVLGKMIYMMQMQGLNPNIFDIKFKLSTAKIMTGAYPSYVLKLSEFTAIDESDQEQFGAIYQQFAAAPQEEVTEEYYGGQTIDASVTKVVDEYHGEDVSY